MIIYISTEDCWSYQMSMRTRRPYERGVQPVHRRGPESQEGGLWISEGSHIIGHRCFILIFFIFCVFSSIFSLFRKYNYVKFPLISELCLSLLCIKDMLSRHSAAQEIKHSWQFTSRLIGPQIFNFERSLSLSPGPQSSLVHLVKCLLEALRTRTYSYS